MLLTFAFSVGSCYSTLLWGPTAPQHGSREWGHRSTDEDPFGV